MKLYCYVDETGQESKGEIFLVCCSIILTVDNKEKLEKKLLAIEKRIGKRSKWHKTKWQIKIAYLKELLRISELKGNIYVKKFANTKKYFDKTLEVIAESLKFDKRYYRAKAIVIIDGLARRLEPLAATRLRRENLYIDKVRGAREESTSLVRLSDAIVGFARDCLKDKEWTKELYQIFLNKGVITEIKNKTPAKGEQS